MLFSDDQVSAYINQHFEAAWQSVRPVPVVRIDFGHGHVITRTLHGNIATYICLPNGQVIDVLPGLYEPRVYLEQLRQANLLTQYVHQSDHANVLRDYHLRQAAAIERHGQPAELRHVSRGHAITGRELGVKVALRPLDRLHSRSRNLRGKSMLKVPREKGEHPVNWSLLQEDTLINETVRRPIVHRFLADHESITPDDMQKWLYREVLKADLDDPYLGLRELLFDDVTR